MKILNIPFISKPKSISKTIWIAKYLIDDNWQVLDEWCELLEWTEFRWKESYWNHFDKKVINFRKGIMLNDAKNEKLTSDKLKQVNNYFFKNLKTILNHDSFTTWSNPTWSDYDFRRTPYLIYGWNYNQFMFINFFKKLRKKWKIKADLRYFTYEEIDLENYLETFKDIKNDFLDFNKVLLMALESTDINETKEIDNREDIKWIVDMVLSPEYEIQKNISEPERNEKRVQTLRRIFKNRLRSIPPSDHLFWELPEDMCEAAHIFPVSEIKKLDIQYWYMIADENNGLNLPTQIHKLYDSNKIYFDQNWWLNFTNEEYKKHLSIMFNFNWNYKIINSILNEKRKSYINRYNKEVLSI